MSEKSQTLVEFEEIKKQCAERIWDLEGKTVDSRVEQGRELNKLKTSPAFKHGDWMPSIATLPFSDSTALGYMNAAKLVDEMADQGIF